ncbi:MAG: hypothetical protein AAFR93_05940 [Pseudomonadota bacterium]
MVGIDDRVLCRTPAAPQGTGTNIPVWKFEAVRSAILAELSRGKAPASALVARVRDRLPAHELGRLGSLGWHVTTIRLEMEVRGEVARLSEGPLVVGLGPHANSGL